MVADRQVVLEAERLQHYTIPYRERQTQLITRVSWWDKKREWADHEREVHSHRCRDDMGQRSQGRRGGSQADPATGDVVRDCLGRGAWQGASRWKRAAGGVKNRPGFCLDFTRAVISFPPPNSVEFCKHLGNGFWHSLFFLFPLQVKEVSQDFFPPALNCHSLTATEHA